MDRPPDETHWERVDRNLDELMQELRIALPGVQVLFAFLLAVPFQSRFGQVTPFQEKVYFVTLLLAAVSALTLIAPTAFHRVTFRRQQKDRLLLFANRLTIAGLITLGLAVIGAVVLVTDFLFGATLTWIVGGGSFLLYVGLWLALPFRARGRGPVT